MTISYNWLARLPRRHDRANYPQRDADAQRTSHHNHGDGFHWMQIIVPSGVYSTVAVTASPSTLSLNTV